VLPVTVSQPALFSQYFRGTSQTMATDFPPAVEQFIAQHIESLAQLETLLLLRRQADRGLSVAELSRQLYISPEVCAGIVADLERRGFIERIPGDSEQWRYQVGNAATDSLIDQLAALYQERRVAVITHIYSKPVKQVQTFADAFRLRKEP
jgi:DNA-binding Lrp family transcriptional regulator